VCRMSRSLRTVLERTYFLVCHTHGYLSFITHFPVFPDRTGTPRPVVNSRGRRRRAGTKTLAQLLRCDEENFIDFIAKCLHWDPERRLKPQAALRHAFVTAGRHRPLPATHLPNNLSRSLLTSRSPCVKTKPEILKKAPIGAPMSLVASAFGNHLTPGPSVPPMQDAPTARMHAPYRSISQSHRHRSLHHTDATPKNSPKIDDSSNSNHNQGDSPVEAEDDGVEDPKGYLSSPYLRQLLGQGRLIYSIQGREAAELGSKLHLVCHHFETRHHVAHAEIHA
jgi:serine/threonine protein kinase